ncbi:hypothetical protein [Kordiimonas lacus]|uniref:SGNH hydrolase-type esterase domain-containing protein n=1 Tax=Kordiimonas lacus TaxID=637679 RepID=A0A1G6ZGX1_9PROT|nr:hypothetical protein [Kordiimonas lacus]SDE01702.1 hypothetical protein SAMN04488071_1806 [Kordiimonas lacus]
MIILIGDSHTSCLIRAAAERPAMDSIRIAGLGPGGQLVHDFFTRHDNHISFSLRRSRQALLRLTGKNTMRRGDQFLFGISLGLFPFRVCQNTSWRRFAPANFSEGTDKMPLSDAVTDAIIRDDTKGQRAFFEAVKSLDIPFFVMASPPLQRHLPILQRNVSKDVILHMESRYHHVMTSFLNALDVDVIMPPDGVRAEDGFLRQDLETEIEGDIRHANTAYGHMMLDKIQAYLETNHADRLQPKLTA